MITALIGMACLKYLGLNIAWIIPCAIIDLGAWAIVKFYEEKESN